MTHFKTRSQQVAFRTGPRRHIEKIQNTIHHIITNTVIESVLHQVEDRETLVRAIIQLTAKNINNGTFALALYHEPRGITMESLVTNAESLDDPMSKVQLWKYSGIDDLIVAPILVDLKSMRKLEPGDQIVLRDIGEVAQLCDLDGVITLFFKV